jgi:hypothetical protein
MTSILAIAACVDDFNQHFKVTMKNNNEFEKKSFFPSLIELYSIESAI